MFRPFKLILSRIRSIDIELREVRKIQECLFDQISALAWLSYKNIGVDSIREFIDGQRAEYEEYLSNSRSGHSNTGHTQDDQKETGQPLSCQSPKDRASR